MTTLCSKHDGNSAVRAQTDKRTDGQTDATKCIISLASRSIKIGQRSFVAGPMAYTIMDLELQIGASRHCLLSMILSETFSSNVPRVDKSEWRQAGVCQCIYGSLTQTMWSISWLSLTESILFWYHVHCPPTIPSYTRFVFPLWSSDKKE